MKFGVKTFDDSNFADYFKDKADFLEVMAIPGKDYSFLEGYPLPIVVHVLHSGFGVNFADRDLIDKNKEAINFAVGLSDRFGAKKIIVHAGFLCGDNCSINNSVNLLKGLDERIVIENVTRREKERFCSIPDEVEDFIFEVDKDFCFDVNHAMEVAFEDGKGIYYYVEDFLKMKPAHFHFGGGVVGDIERQHLSFKDSDFSVEKVLREFPEDAWVTIETTTDIEGVERDLEFLRGLEKMARG